MGLDVDVRWKFGLAVDPIFCIRWRKSREYFHILVDGSVGTLVSTHKHEPDKSRSVAIPGERSQVSFERLPGKFTITFHAANPKRGQETPSTAARPKPLAGTAL